MAYNNYTYVIINASEVSSVDFSKIKETSNDTLRYSSDNSKTFVRFEGNTPDFLEGKTQYTHEEIMSFLDNSANGWVSSSE
jgi:hypothetical protein|tara:strand:+ start:249 stop:491 length:243 start_codon:yes stop_codon:yes gene_type:complete